MRNNLLLALLTLPLAACGGGNGDDALAEQARQSGEQQAEATLANGGTEAAAEQLREAGEARAEMIDQNNVDAENLTDAQKAALVTGGSAVQAANSVAP